MTAKQLDGVRMWFDDGDQVIIKEDFYHPVTGKLYPKGSTVTIDKKHLMCKLDGDKISCWLYDISGYLEPKNDGVQ